MAYISTAATGKPRHPWMITRAPIRRSEDQMGVLANRMAHYEGRRPPWEQHVLLDECSLVLNLILQITAALHTRKIPCWKVHHLASSRPCWDGKKLPLLAYQGMRCICRCMSHLSRSLPDLSACCAGGYDQAERCRKYLQGPQGFSRGLASMVYRKMPRQDCLG